VEKSLQQVQGSCARTGQTLKMCLESKYTFQNYGGWGQEEFISCLKENASLLVTILKSLR